VQDLKTRLRNLAVKARAAWKHASVDSHEVWTGNLQSELDWWKTHLANCVAHPETSQQRGGVFFRLNPDAELQPEIARFIHSADAKILDVGAGPLTVLGKVWQGRRLDITAVDPLARQYSSLLESLQLVPTVSTRFGEAEALTADFEPDSFDLAHARNCLDHSYDPVKAIREMLAVTKPGGVVFLNHSKNEGKRVAYIGLHQWNFRELHGHFVISAPGKRTVNVSKLLTGSADVSVEVKNGWISVVVEKREHRI
jgi:SAM-dependent methyltransferase